MVPRDHGSWDPLQWQGIQDYDKSVRQDGSEKELRAKAPFLFEKIFQKGVDNRAGMCYNDYSKREEETEMTEWYMNPELHDEDFAELADLLAEEDTEG